MAVGAIVLAAGASTRMGRQKLLLPFAGTSVVAHIVRELQSAPVAAVHVVVGHEPQRIRAALGGLNVTIVENPNYASGMLSSVRAGLASAPKEWSAALIVLGDQPLIRAAHVTALIAAHATDPGRILVPGHEGRRGHPLLLPRRDWDEALTQHDTAGLRGLLHAHADRGRMLELGTEDVLTDMDTPQDYDRILARAQDRRGGESERDLEGR
jgi:CTP:molybdopterin cytidylyltransferase MocA